MAKSFRSRLLGLALQPPRHALLIPRCSCIHTFGMRFALDLVWLDARGRVIAIDLAVPPGRVVARRDARAVLEAPAGWDIVAAVASESFVRKIVDTLDPRVPIYRDAYNEYFVLVL